MPDNNPTTYDCLITGGYEFIQAAPMEDGRFEVVMTKNGRTVTLLTDEPFRVQKSATNILSDTSGNYYAKRDAEMFESGYIAGWISRDNENGEDYTAEESYAEFSYEAARS
jgi:hypothetical protein